VVSEEIESPDAVRSIAQASATGAGAGAGAGGGPEGPKDGPGRVSGFEPKAPRPEAIEGKLGPSGVGERSRMTRKERFLTGAESGR
jgi:hypothetical protein